MEMSKLIEILSYIGLGIAGIFCMILYFAMKKNDKE